MALFDFDLQCKELGCSTNSKWYIVAIVATSSTMTWFGVSPHRTRKSSQSHGLTCLISDLPRIFMYLPIDWGSFLLGFYGFKIHGFFPSIFPIEMATAWVGRNPWYPCTCFDFQPTQRTRMRMPRGGVFFEGGSHYQKAWAVGPSWGRDWGPLGWWWVRIISWFESRDHERFMWGIKDIKVGITGDGWLMIVPL